jgi:aminoglycoside/choline kinase family phosphotransferase
MRLGPLTYDLVSLLLDPYVALPAGFQAELLDRFATAVVGTGPAGSLSATDIRAMALGAGLQRVMQALGAYGFLGHVKGKRFFLDHIPAGLAVLREILGELEDGASGEMEAAGRWLPVYMPVLERLLDSAE